MKIDFQNVTCQSAFDISREKPLPLHLRNAAPSAPPVWLVELRDVMHLPGFVRPGKGLSLVDEHVVPAETQDPWHVNFFMNEWRNADADRRNYTGEFEVGYSEQKVCILANMYSSTFGHWTEELLKVAVLEDAHVDCCYVIAGLPPFARQFLGFLGIDDRRIISDNRPTIYSRAVYTTTVSHGNLSDRPHVLSLLRELVESRVVAGSSRYGPRLWLERGEMTRNGGHTLNKDEVYRCLADYGFDVVDMASLSVPDQMSTMHGARIIAGSHGSQFVHAQFMPPCSTVIECFSPIYINPSIFQICKVLKHSYHQVVARNTFFAPYPQTRDCEVDCEHLSLVLDSL
jgi:hypothetical protein